MEGAERWTSGAFFRLCARTQRRSCVFMPRRWSAHAPWRSPSGLLGLGVPATCPDGAGLAVPWVGNHLLGEPGGVGVAASSQFPGKGGYVEPVRGGPASEAPLSLEPAFGSRLLSPGGGEGGAWVTGEELLADLGLEDGGVGRGDLVSADGGPGGHVGDPVGEDVLVPEKGVSLVDQVGY